MDIWRDVLRTTLDGTFLCCRAAAPHLAKSGSGTIINFGGVSAHTGARNAVATVTAKSGLLQKHLGDSDSLGVADADDAGFHADSPPSI